MSTTYFGPIQWYQKLRQYDRVFIDQHETFPKQTYRNRCLIATTQGIQPLTVPVVHSSKTTTGEVLISDHGNWRHLHWQALQSAYGDSPFFEYYEDDLRPFFTEHNWTSLVDFNDAICRKMCDLIDVQPNISFTDEFVTPHLSPQPSTPDSPSAPSHIPSDDFRFAITPKHPTPDPTFVSRPYYQVYSQKHGFLPNLSILDLLFNMGPESIFFL